MLLHSCRLEENTILLLGSEKVQTQRQSNCVEWKNEQKFRFTGSNFGLISARKRHHECFIDNLLLPKPFTLWCTNRGMKYEPVALEQ